jgi:hypothetical protein
MLPLLLAAAIVLVLAAGAVAYLKTSGSGTGTSGGANGSASPVTISATTGNTSSLLPTGSASGDVMASVSNPNNFSVHIAQLSSDTGAGSSGFSANAANCILTFTAQTNGGSGWTIPATSSTTLDLRSSIAMGTTAASSCQGQTFTAYLKAN